MVTMQTAPIFDIIETSQKPFVLPGYQRDYVWNEKECNDLWRDLFDFASHNDDDDKYFAGKIILSDTDNSFEIVDGQQRIVTLMALSEAFTNISLEGKDIESIHSKIHKCFKNVANIITKDDNYNRNYTFFKNKLISLFKNSPITPKQFFNKVIENCIVACHTHQSLKNAEEIFIRENSGRHHMR